MSESNQTLDAPNATAGPSKPRLILKLPGKSFTSSTTPAATPSATHGTIIAGTPATGSPPPATPAISEGGRKIKIKPRPSVPPTPSDTLPTLHPPPTVEPERPSQSTLVALAEAAKDSPVTKTKAGRTSKPTAKKRAKDQVDDEQEDGAEVGTGTSPKKKIKIVNTPGVLVPTRAPLQKRPSIMVKNKVVAAAAQKRPPGDSYDSEMSDREQDPVTEEQIILRMMPGVDCEYLRTSIAERKIGLPRNMGGADIQLKWIDEESRRAMLTIQGRCYAGVLVDLPTITEAMKTWNRKNLVKSADICQMLLIFASVTGEKEAMEIELPSTVGKGYRWFHGLTPPMHDCVHQRFRGRLSKLEIKDKESEIQRLLDADRAAIDSSIEWVSDTQNVVAMDDDEADASGEEEDADGEQDQEDYFQAGWDHQDGGDADMDDMEADLAADLIAELLNAEDDEAAADIGAENTQDGAEGGTSITANSETPAAQTEDSDAGGHIDSPDDNDDSDSGSGEDDEGDGTGDPAEQAILQEIRELKKQLSTLEAQSGDIKNPLLLKRHMAQIRSIKSEVQLKSSSIGRYYED